MIHSLDVLGVRGRKPLGVVLLVLLGLAACTPSGSKSAEADGGDGAGARGSQQGGDSNPGVGGVGARSGSGGASEDEAGSAGKSDDVPNTTGQGLDLPPLAIPLQQLQRWNEYAFAPPEGFEVDEKPDALILSRPEADACLLLALLPLEPRQADPVAQLTSILLAQTAGLFTGLHDRVTWGPLATAQLGTSGEGWEYLYVDVEFESEEQPHPGVFGRGLLAAVGDQVAPVVAVDRGCDARAVDWSLLFYSLSFPDYRAADPDALARQLLGKWKIGGSGTFSMAWFAANGRYDDTSSLQTGSISGDDLIVTTTTFQGSGAFAVRGNQLSLLPDSGKGHDTHLFRVETEIALDTPEPEARVEQLYELEAFDGVLMEGRMVRDDD